MEQDTKALIDRVFDEGSRGASQPREVIIALLELDPASEEVAYLKERAAEYPVDKVSEITWIPEDQIVAAARMYAQAKPATVQWGLKLDQQTDGMGATQALQCLWAITGNVLSSIPWASTMGGGLALAI